jgi:glycosyltransferase involved in cell wall biosynthesis
MRIAYITAGAAGMYCGSCMRDNTLVSALGRQGHEALLVPTYTPIRTDEEDVSQKRVFFGGINVYLQQKFSLFRHTPGFLDRLLDGRGLLRWVSRFAVRTQARELGELTLSMLRGEHGHQRKEIEKLVRWLADDLQPEVVNLTNALLSGLVGPLKKRLDAPVLCSLQGDDIFTESLPEPYRCQALELIRGHARLIDGFISTSAAYADFMAGYFDIPRDKIHVVLPGINLHGHGAARPERAGKPFTVGYFARICPEKGFHLIIDAFHRLRQTPGCGEARLHVSGWLGENNRAYFEQHRQRLIDAGLQGDFAHIDCPDHESKVRFFQEIDVLSVPTLYREPKGLYVLESLANGVPVVQPRHGSFPELVEQTGGGLLFEPDNPAALAEALARLMADRALLAEMGAKGRAVVHERFHAGRMAEDTVAVYRRYVRTGVAAQTAAVP